MQQTPPANFDELSLSLRSISSGTDFGRIYLQRYPDPLGIGKTKSRFSDPRNLTDDERYGVLYLGSTFSVCFLETYVRDKNVGLISPPVIYEDEIDKLTRQTNLCADQRCGRSFVGRSDCRPRNSHGCANRCCTCL